MKESFSFYCNCGQSRYWISCRPR